MDNSNDVDDSKNCENVHKDDNDVNNGDANDTLMITMVMITMIMIMISQWMLKFLINIFMAEFFIMVSDNELTSHILWMPLPFGYCFDRFF